MVAWVVRVFCRVLGFDVASIVSSHSDEERADIAAEFNDAGDGTPQILVSTYRLAGQGLNLHRACHVLVLFEPANSASITLQAIGRVHRLGATLPQYVYSIHARCTIDRWVEANAARKFRDIISVTKDDDRYRTLLPPQPDPAAEPARADAAEASTAEPVDVRAANLKAIETLTASDHSRRFGQAYDRLNQRFLDIRDIGWGHDNFPSTMDVISDGAGPANVPTSAGWREHDDDPGHESDLPFLSSPSAGKSLRKINKASLRQVYPRCLHCLLSGRSDSCDGRMPCAACLKHAPKDGCVFLCLAHFRAFERQASDSLGVAQTALAATLKSASKESRASVADVARELHVDCPRCRSADPATEIESSVESDHGKPPLPPPFLLLSQTDRADEDKQIHPRLPSPLAPLNPNPVELQPLNVSTQASILATDRNLSRSPDR